MIINKTPLINKHSYQAIICQELENISVLNRYIQRHFGLSEPVPW